MNKKFGSILLALLLAVAACLPALAQEAPLHQDVVLGERIESVVYADGRLLLSGRALYAWRPGEDSLRLLQSYADDDWRQMNGLTNSSSLLLAAEGAQLYALALDDGLLFQARLTEAGLQLSSPVSIDTKALMQQDGEIEYMGQPLQLLVVQGQLHILMRSFGPMGMVTSLVSYDVQAGGEGRKHEIEGLLQMTAYREGRLLCLQAEDTRLMEISEVQRLVDYDPASGAQQLLGEPGVSYRMGVGPMAWDAAEDMLYLSNGEAVYQRDSQGKVAQCAHLIPEYGNSFSGQLQLLPGRRLAVLTHSSLALRLIDPDAKPASSLRIYGAHMDEAHQAAMRAMGGVPVSMLEHRFFRNGQELGQALVSGEDEIDIFMLSGDFIDLSVLMQKGYCADLSGSQALQDYARQLYPWMAAAGQHEGRLMMVPVSFHHRIMSFFPKLQAETGVELPRSIEGLVDFVQHWNDDLAEQYPDLRPMDSTNYRFELLSLVLDRVGAERQVDGQAFSFQDPQLVKLLTRIDTLRTDNIQPDIEVGNRQSIEAARLVADVKMPLIAGFYHLSLQEISENLLNVDSAYFMSYGVGEGRDVGRPQPLVMSVFEGEEPRFPVTLSLMAVNPRSKHLDQAIRYVEAYVNALKPEEQAMLMPDRNEPIESADYAEHAARIDEYVASMKQEVAGLEGAEKTQGEEQLKQLIEETELEKQRDRWVVSAEGLAAYRQLMSKAYARPYSAISMMMQSEDVTRLLMRYAQGEAPLLQFLQEAEGKLRLMMLENQ